MRHQFTNAEITGAWLDGLHNASTRGYNKRHSQRFSGDRFYSYNLLIAARITEHRFLLYGARSSVTTNAHIRRLERELMGRKAEIAYVNVLDPLDVGRECVLTAAEIRKLAEKVTRCRSEGSVIELFRKVLQAVNSMTLLTKWFPEHSKHLSTVLDARDEFYDAEDFRGFIKHKREQNNEQN